MTDCAEQIHYTHRNIHLCSSKIDNEIKKWNVIAGTNFFPNVTITHKTRLFKC